jgi:hypothetical protein
MVSVGLGGSEWLKQCEWFIVDVLVVLSATRKEFQEDD